MYYQIKPKQEVIIKTYVTESLINIIDSINIKITELVLNQYAVIQTDFFSQGLYIKKTLDKIEGTDYADWTSDEYIVDYIVNKYGLELL